MEPKVTVVAAIDEKVYNDMGACLRTQDGEWFSNWAQECVALRGWRLVARVSDQIGANAVIYTDLTTGSVLETDYALAMIEGLPEIKVSALATVNAAEWEGARHVHYAKINEGEGGVIAHLIQTTGYQIIKEHTFGVFPGSCMVRYRDGDGERAYAFVAIEEVCEPKTIALVPDYHALFVTFMRDANIFAKSLRNAKVGYEPTRREQDMHSFISRVSVCASSLTTTEEIEQLRAVLALCAENLNHAETIMDSDEDLSGGDEHILVEHGQAWRCLCGNTAMSSGFFTCDTDGNQIEPDIHGKWDGVRYVCAECGRIINQYTRAVIGRRA